MSGAAAPHSFWSLDVFANESQRDSASMPQVARGNSEAPRATWGCRTPCSSTSKRLRPLVDPVGLTYPFQLGCILNPKCTAYPIPSGVCARAPQFILKTRFSVVFLLPQNIRFDVLKIGLTH